MTECGGANERQHNMTDDMTGARKAAQRGSRRPSRAEKISASNLLETGIFAHDQ
jgi:hypothetical protein